MSLDKFSPEAANGLTAAINAALRAGVFRLDRQPKPAIIFFEYGESHAASIVTPYGLCGFILSPRNIFRTLVAEVGGENMARILFAPNGPDLREMGRAVVVASFSPQRGDGKHPTFEIYSAHGSGRAAAEMSSHVKPLAFYAVKVSDDTKGTSSLISVPNVGLLHHQDNSISFTNGDDDNSIIRRLSDDEVSEWKALGRPSDADSIAALFFSSGLTA